MINVIAEQIMQIYDIKTFVETGIDHGRQIHVVRDWLEKINGDDFMMYEIDNNPEVIKLVSPVFKDDPNVEIIESNSEDWLKSAVDSNLFVDRTMFFLDAHWYDQHPLLMEIESIMRLNNKPIIAIDDFNHPHSTSISEFSIHAIRPLVEPRTNVVVHARDPQSPELNLGQGGNRCAFVFVDVDLDELKNDLGGLYDKIVYEGL